MVASEIEEQSVITTTQRKPSFMSSSVMSTEEVKQLETEEIERQVLEIHPNFRLFLSAQAGYGEDEEE